MDPIIKMLMKQVSLLIVKDTFRDLSRQEARELAERAGKPEKRQEFEDHLIKVFKIGIEKIAVVIDRSVEKNSSDEAYSNEKKKITANLEKGENERNN